MNIKTKAIIASSLSAVLLAVAAPAFAGLGISPSDWIEANAPRGAQIEKIFTLSRSNAEQDLYFTSEITGDITSWLTIDNGNSFMIPKGAQQYPVKVILKVPTDSTYKNYKGEIRLKSSTNESQAGGGSSVGVLLSALIRIDLTVSDKPFLSYDVLQIDVPNQEQHHYLDVFLKLWNKGNVEAKPTKLTMDLFDKFNTTKLGSETFTDFASLTGVAPFTQGKIHLQIPISATLTPEQYWAKIDLYQDDKIIKTEDITFDIINPPPPVVAASTKQQGSGLWGFITIINGLYLLGVILLIILGIIIIKKLTGHKNVARSGGSSLARAPLQDTKETRRKVIKEIETDIDELLEKKVKE